MNTYHDIATNERRTITLRSDHDCVDKSDGRNTSVNSRKFMESDQENCKNAKSGKTGKSSTYTYTKIQNIPHQVLGATSRRLG